MKTIKADIKNKISDYFTYIGYYAHRWNIIKDNNIYLLHYDEQEGKLYFVICNIKGKTQEFLVDTFDPYSLMTYEMVLHNNQIIAVYVIYGNDYKNHLYSIIYDIEEQTISNPIFIKTLDILAEEYHISNLYSDGNKVYFLAYETKKSSSTYFAEFIRHYPYIFAWDGENWNNVEIVDENDDKLKFIEQETIEYNFKPTTYVSYLNYNIKSLKVLFDGTYGSISGSYNENTYPFGFTWFPNTIITGYQICPSWTRNMAYEPTEGCYNGDLPKYKYDYEVGDLIRFYDGYWENIYNDVRNDIVLKCIIAGKSTDTFPSADLRTKKPGDTFSWGGALFRVYYIRSYTIAYRRNPYRTGGAEPSPFTYGTFLTSLYQDAYLYYFHGQVRPQVWLPNQVFRQGEYIIENDKLFFATNLLSNNDYYGYTGSSKPYFASLQHNDTITDGDITWKCFDISRYLYCGEIEKYIPSVNEEFLWQNKRYIYLLGNPVPGIKYELYNNEYDKAEFELDEDKKFDLNSLELNFNTTYKLNLKPDNLNDNAFSLPLQFIHYGQYNRIENKINLYGYNDKLIITQCYKATKRDPSHPGKPYDTIVLSKNNFSILNKDNFFPSDYESDTDWELYTKVIINLNENIYVAENNSITWAEQLRKLHFDDTSNSLVLDWIKSLPEETTYNDNKFIFTDGNKIYFFFHYDKQSFIIKIVDLNGENGEAYLIKFSKNIFSWYDDVYANMYIFKKKNNFVIPVHYSKYDYNKYFAIIKPQSNLGLTELCFYYPFIGEDVENTIIKEEKYGSKI